MDPYLMLAAATLREEAFQAEYGTQADYGSPQQQTQAASEAAPVEPEYSEPPAEPPQREPPPPPTPDEIRHADLIEHIRSLSGDVQSWHEQQSNRYANVLSDQIDQLARRTSELEQRLTAPRRIVRDERGKAIGSVIDMELARASLRAKEAPSPEPAEKLLPDGGGDAA
jgi:hypothetical protein